MAKPGLLLWSRGLDSLIDPAVAARFDVIRLWQAEDRDALLAERGAAVTATVTTQIAAADIERLPILRLIVVPGAGYEHVDVAAARRRGITVANAGDTHSGDVADHAVALTLAAIHRLAEGEAWIRDGHWAQRPQRWRRHALSAQRFGIVGLGRIGHAIADRLVSFGGEIAWWGPRAKDAPWRRHESLLDLAHWCSVLIVAARGDAAGLIDAGTIAAVGADGLIVNIARGAVIDEDAMIAALKAGTLGSAALDVFVEEPTPPERWRDVPNVLLTPHVAGLAHESLARLNQAASRNLLSLLDGTPVVNEITE